MAALGGCGAWEHGQCDGAGCACPCHAYEENPLPIMKHVPRFSYADPYRCVVCRGHVADASVHVYAGGAGP